tara:strand:- start:523 stop:1119 length:597 start_codon:yes stop_codon:yes gene_type:complete
MYQIGVDEVGRGCFAGPVVAAAVLWDPAFENDTLKKIKDSKKITEKNRNFLSMFIKENALSYGICFVDSKTVDKFNILNATFEAMHGAIKECIDKIPNGIEIDQLLIDGNRFKKYNNIPHTCIPSGDSLHLSIASASIIAKVARDEYILKLCESQPDLHEKYDWKKNKCYGTKKHIEGIKQHGLTELHRKTFGICKEF